MKIGDGFENVISKYNENIQKYINKCYNLDYDEVPDYDELKSYFE